MILDKFRKHIPEPPDVVVIKSTEPNTCGGTDATRDMRAPVEIVSADMEFFMVEESFTTMVFEEAAESRLLRFSAYAAKHEQGAFLYVSRQTVDDCDRTDVRMKLVSHDIFPELVSIVREYKLAANNGFHSRTHGLPENFGGSIDVRYAGGERISISDNQSPVLSYEAAQAIDRVFEKAFKADALPLPDLQTLKEIRFEEERKDGGFTRAALEILPDGTGVNRKQSRYDDPKVYESEKPVDAGTVSAIKDVISSGGILAWSGIRTVCAGMREKCLTFVFPETEITVTNDRELPRQLSGAFFDIELEMTTKH